MNISNLTLGSSMTNHIYWHNHKIDKIKRAAMKGQSPCVLWFTGLSASGKSSIANAVEEKLHERNYHTYLLDGDNIRKHLCNDLNFGKIDRIENIRRIGEVSKLMVDAGLIVITAFISPFKSDRSMVRNGLGKNEFVEIFVDTPLSVCESRDPKGLYSQARNGDIENFTGLSSPYENPDNPEIHLKNTDITIDGASNQIINYLISHNHIGQPQFSSNF